MRKLSIVTELDNARKALVNAKTDFERIQIRDQAKALEACAAVLKRKDIQIHASHLVKDAERIIHNSRPPKKPEETGRGKKLVEEPTSLSPNEMRDWQRAWTRSKNSKGFRIHCYSRDAVHSTGAFQNYGRGV